MSRDNGPVEYLFGEGYDVYMLNSLSPNARDTGRTPGDHGPGYPGAAVREVVESSGSEEVTHLDRSPGGTLYAMYAMYAALFPGKLGDPVPLVPGGLGLWTLGPRFGV